MKNEKMKKLVVFIGALVVLSSIGTAVWMSSMSDGFTANVVSTDGNPLQISINFEDALLNTTTSTATEKTFVNFTNNNGQMWLGLEINETRIDIDDNCESYLDDCVINYTINSDGNTEGITTGDILNITSGDYMIESTILCKRASCPGSIEVEVKLIEE